MADLFDTAPEVDNDQPVLVDRINKGVILLGLIFVLGALAVGVSLVLGCAATRPTGGKTDRAIVTVGPVIVTSDGEWPGWLTSMTWQDHVAKFYDPTPFRVVLAPTETLERPGWFDGAGPARVEMMAWAKARFKRTGIVTAFYVDDIKYPRFRICGLAFRSNQCFFVRCSRPRVVAHELGHILGLADLTGDKMCGPVRHCNVMTYCPDAWPPDCDGPLWGRKQLLLMRLPRR